MEKKHETKTTNNLVRSGHWMSNLVRLVLGRFWCSVSVYIYIYWYPTLFRQQARIKVDLFLLLTAPLHRQTGTKIFTVKTHTHTANKDLHLHKLQPPLPQPLLHTSITAQVNNQKTNCTKCKSWELQISSSSIHRDRDRDREQLADSSQKERNNTRRQQGDRDRKEGRNKNWKSK